jgi:hemolysin III
MSESHPIEKYSFLEEIFNSITHGIGALISIAGLVLLIVFSIMYGNLNHIISCTIFGFTLVLLYTASTLYHSFQKTEFKTCIQDIGSFLHLCFDCRNLYSFPFGNYTGGYGLEHVCFGLVPNFNRGFIQNLFRSPL